MVFKSGDYIMLKPGFRAGCIENWIPKFFHAWGVYRVKRVIENAVFIERFEFRIQVETSWIVPANFIGILIYWITHYQDKIYTYLISH